MLRFRNELPFDYSLCRQTVAVYHREGLTRRVLEGVHFEQTVANATEGAVTDRTHSFLLVIPFENGVQPGDRIYETEDGPGFVAKSVKDRTFMGRFCHTEVRG